MREIMMIVMLLSMLGISDAATYYVDSAGGNDANSGTSENSAWQSIEKVNATTFSPGDQILLKANSMWLGKLNPKGSGASGNPITLDMYGSGAKPLIDANGSEGFGAFYLVDQQYWEVRNLSLTNDGEGNGDRRGVHIYFTTPGMHEHIYVMDCDIHNIRGTNRPSGSAAKRTGGIMVEAYHSSGWFNDLRIEGCTVENVGGTGIMACRYSGVSDDHIPGPTGTWEDYRCTNFRIRNNLVSHVYRNGLIARRMDDSCVIEYNVFHHTAEGYTGNTMFTAPSRGVIFQYNEGYENQGVERDGSLYDADLGSREIVFQYSYSHDNSHGLFWTYPRSHEHNDNIIVRYNISRNDRGNIFSFSGGANSLGSTHIYNNTIYTPAHLSPQFFDDRRDGAHTYYVYNNIFYNLSPTASYGFGDSTRTFSHNVFYGEHPAGEPDDPYKLTSDPTLMNPGSGGLGIDSLDGYKLAAVSPCIDSGFEVPNNGGLDYWGNAVPLNGITDRGAHEWSATGGPDTTIPTPDPMTWATPPHATGTTEISMTATTASDPSGVQYYFTCTVGDGNDSGWIPFPSYTDTGLAPDSTYSYTVKARDLSLNRNETGTSSAESATTDPGSAPPTVLFADGFDEGFAPFWTSTAFLSGEEYEGVRSAKMNNTDFVETGIDTTGYGDIQVTYARRTSNLEEGNSFTSEWFDGVQWNTIESITTNFSGWLVVSQLSLPAAANYNPDFRLRFQVDAGGNFAYVDSVVVEGVLGSPPSFVSDPVVEVKAEQDSAYNATLADDASDPDFDPMTFVKLSGPDWLQVAANGSLSGTPTNSDVGLNSFTIQVSAVGGVDSASLEITVSEPPRWNHDPIEERDAIEYVNYDSTLADDATGGDAGDTLTFVLVNGPDWLEVAADGSLSGTPQSGDVGINNWTVSVSNGSSQEIEASLSIEVLALGENRELFSDGFEMGFAPIWDSTSFLSGQSYEETRAAKMNNTDYVEAGIDTTGYSGILVTYARNTSELSVGSSFSSEWFDGTSWNAIEEITTDFTDWQVVSQVVLPVGANDNPNFRVRFRVDTSGGFAYVDSIVVEGLLGTPASFYTQWVDLYPSLGGSVAQFDDADSDGIVNWAEYALGGNPTSNDAASVLPEVSMDVDGSWLYYTYQRRDDAAARGIDYTVLSGDNFLDGLNNVVPTWSVSPATNGFETATHRLSTDEGPRGFMRLEIER